MLEMASLTTELYGQTQKPRKKTIHVKWQVLKWLTSNFQGKQGFSIKVRYCIYWENMLFILSSVPKLPLSMGPSRGKMMKSDNPAPDSLICDYLVLCYTCNRHSTEFLTYSHRNIWVIKIALTLKSPNGQKLSCIFQAVNPWHVNSTTNPYPFLLPRDVSCSGDTGNKSHGTFNWFLGLIQTNSAWFFVVSDNHQER